MVAATAAVGVKTRGIAPSRIAYPVNATSQIWKGTLVALDATGNAVAASDVAGDNAIVGVAQESRLGGAADGDVWVTVLSGGIFEFTAVAITQAMVGTPMYVVDDQTIDDQSGVAANRVAGLLVEYVSTTKGFIAIPFGGTALMVPPKGAMLSRAVQLTDTQVLALATTAGEELIPAPGANKSIIVDRFHIVADASDTAWTEPSAPDDLVVQYAGGADISGAIEAGALVANSVNVRTYGVLDTEVIPEANAAVNLFNSGANWGGGNAANTMSVRIWYSIVDTIAFT